MKTTTLFLILGLLSGVCNAQLNCTTALDDLNRRVGIVNASGDSLITNRAFNRLLAGKLGFYLTGTTGRTLFGNYASVDVTDGQLFAGGTKVMGRFSDDRVKDLFSYGLSADVVKGVATLFGTNNLSPNLIGNLKWTRAGIFYPATVWFDGTTQRQKAQLLVAPGPQKHKMDVRREVALRQLQQKMNSECADFEASVGGLSISDQATERSKFKAKLKKDSEDNFFDQEADASDGGYNRLFMDWLTVNLDVPFTAIRYDVAPNDLAETATVEKAFRPWKLSTNYGAVFEWNSGRKLYVGFSASVFHNNSILTEEIKKVRVKEKQIVTVGDQTTEVMIKGNDERYVGEYEPFWNGKLRPQAVYYGKLIKNIGLNAYLEQTLFGQAPLEAGFGIIFNLKDNEGKPKVNFELILKNADLTNRVDNETSFGEKLTVGVSATLPFNSILYK